MGKASTLIERDKQKVPLYKAGQQLDQLTVLRILKTETIANCGVSNWEELLDQSHQIKKQYYPNIVYLVCYKCCNHKMIGYDIYIGLNYPQCGMGLQFVIDNPINKI